MSKLLKKTFLTKAIWIALMAAEIAGCMLFVIPMTVKVTNAGAVLGLLFFLLCFGITLFIKPVFGIVKAMAGHTAGRLALIFLAVLFSAMIVYAGTLTVLMLCAANAQPQNPDVVIVLGCRVQPDGSPSLMLKKRVDAAYEYLSENNGVSCIVSGGRGSDEPLSEAETMKNLLVKMGIAEERITVEDKSESTRQNIEFSLKRLENEGTKVSEAAIVTDGFHQFRASLIVKESGIKPTAVSAETPKWLVPPYWVREWLALSHRFVFGS